MVNSTILQGRLVRDPEYATTSSGIELSKFTVAWSEEIKDYKSQLFLNCVAWRQTGAFVNKYFKKGQAIIVQGKLETVSYTNKNGESKSLLQLVVDKVSFCGSKNENTSGQSPTPVQSQQTMPINTDDYEEIDGVDDEDLPF